VEKNGIHLDYATSTLENDQKEDLDDVPTSNKKNIEKDVKDEEKINIPSGAAPVAKKRIKTIPFRISCSETMAFIFGLAFGPALDLGSPTQNYPGYTPNNN